MPYDGNPSHSRGQDRRIVVRGQPGQKVTELLISTNKLGVVAHACDPSYVGGVGKRMVV
jgi:hypothetical protein